MRIGELAAKANTSTRALRYYESQGLLEAKRAGNGYRVYDEADLRIVDEIRSLLTLGFSLEDTRPFVECLRAGNETGDVCPNSVAVYRRKLAELDECVARLGDVRERLETQIAHATERARTIGATSGSLPYPQGLRPHEPPNERCLPYEKNPGMTTQNDCEGPSNDRICDRC